MNPLFHTEFSISDSLKNVRKSVLIYETIILLPDMISKRLVDLIIIEFQIKSSKITLNDKRAS